ncbi:hypothetical protein [Pseudorhodoferax sp.]|uniref:hypothetical protein n=1 Tax=Pseudorhodoferax sp. TaxID=1993553 RepID=UPI0039E6A0B0
MCPEPRAARAFPPLWSALAAAVLAGCAVPPPAPLPPPAVPAAPPPPAVVAPPPAGPVVALPVQGGLPGGVRTEGSTTSHALLVYADRVRRMAPSELAQELTRLSETPEPQRQPGQELQLAIALAQTRVPADLARALGLTQRVLGNPREEARGLYPLAGMLAARYAEQRRVEDALDRQAQQLRDQQRRIDQLNERLEAMRALERSLTSRPAPANNGAQHRLPQQP